MISKSNNSVVYLALLCLLYFLITSSYLPFTPLEEKTIDENLIFIEISEDGASSVKTLRNARDLKEIQSRYFLSRQIVSGDKIIAIDNDITVSKMSGRKRISLRIPIGINTASAGDLTAIPGIGEELAHRIISSREDRGGFKDLDELDSIYGIGSKKLGEIKKYTDID